MTKCSPLARSTKAILRARLDKDRFELVINLKTAKASNAQSIGRSRCRSQDCSNFRPSWVSSGGWPGKLWS